ncbi:MAG TPA: PKD domain-containing protein, partial [Kineosporiaceae bacterium]|nr:PKD domain-containing protein [Kineosporiaceae bacterium]
HIFRLNRTTQTWTDTGTRIDDRPSSRGDSLWDGKHLYVATNVLAVSSAGNIAGQPARLYRYSYKSAGHTYTLDAGFPVTIGDSSSESLTLDKDSKGVLWATWTQAQNVYVNSTNGTDTSWGTPFALDVPGASGLSADDISAVAAYGRSKIGLMWSNQTTSTFYFATHRDGDARTTWSARAALSDANIADDHLDLKPLQGDAAGHLYAAVKTSLDLTGSPTAPQALLLSLNVNTGAWQSTQFGTVADCHTRPMIAIDATNKLLHMYATAPSSGDCPHTGTAGTVYEKTTPLAKLAFPAGRGTPVIRDAASAEMDDNTGTKQNVTPSTGLVVLASNSVTQQYWHADLPLRGTAPAVKVVKLAVGFKASPVSKKSPLVIRFAGTSTGGVTRWSWKFGDARTATGQKPTHAYKKPGTYTVTVTGTTAKGKRAATTRKIQVTRPPRAAH